jgi:predicted dinucleotide-binding enzyme
MSTAVIGAGNIGKTLAIELHGQRVVPRVRELFA